MPKSDATTADDDLVSLAAKALTREPQAVTTPESSAAEATPTGDDEAQPEAKQGSVGEESAESEPKAPAQEADKDGAEDDADGSKALRAAVDRDPALALVPQIRERLGLPPLNGSAPKTEVAPKGALVFDKIPTDAEFEAAYGKEYEDKMKAGDDLGAIRAVARAEALRAAGLATRQAVSNVMAMARDGGLVDQFADAHPEFGKRKAEVYARLQDLRKKTDVDGLTDVQVLMLLDPRPSKSVVEAAGALLQRAGQKKAAEKAAAASAAAAPTNQRPAGIPSAAQKPKTAIDLARERMFGEVAATSKATQLYDLSKVQRR